MTIPYQVECPFCGRTLTVVETTNREQAHVGLVYVSTKCTDCNARIDGAGVGENAARVAMNDKLRKRIGTRPEQWNIRPSGRTRRRGPRR